MRQDPTVHDKVIAKAIIDMSINDGNLYIEKDEWITNTNFTLSTHKFDTIIFPDIDKVSILVDYSSITVTGYGENYTRFISPIPDEDYKQYKDKLLTIREKLQNTLPFSNNPEYNDAHPQDIIDYCINENLLKIMDDKWDKKQYIIFESPTFKWGILPKDTRIILQLNVTNILLDVYKGNKLIIETQLGRSLYNEYKQKILNYRKETLDNTYIQELLDHCISRKFLNLNKDEWNTKGYITFYTKEFYFGSLPKCIKVIIELTKTDITIDVYEDKNITRLTTNKTLYNKYSPILLNIKDTLKSPKGMEPPKNEIRNIQNIDFANLSKKTKDSILTLISLLITKSQDFIPSDNGYYYTFKQGTEVSIYRDDMNGQTTGVQQLFIKMNGRIPQGNDITIKVYDEDMINTDDPEYLSLLRNLYNEIKNNKKDHNDQEEYIPNEKIFATIVDCMEEIQ